MRSGHVGHAREERKKHDTRALFLSAIVAFFLRFCRGGVGIHLGQLSRAWIPARKSFILFLFRYKRRRFEDSLFHLNFHDGNDKESITVFPTLWHGGWGGIWSIKTKKSKLTSAPCWPSQWEGEARKDLFFFGFISRHFMSSPQFSHKCWRVLLVFVRYFVTSFKGTFHFHNYFLFCL